METISARELDRYAADEGSVIIDLRSSQEYAKDHVSGAVNIPRGRFFGEPVGWKGRTLILYCERGALSMAVARELEKRGYRTKSVVGGFRAYRKGEVW